MKLSEITTKDIVNYLRLTETDTNVEKELSTFLEIAINYIENYTGIPRKTEQNIDEENLDTYTDFVIVAYILCQDMYDNRALYPEKNVSISNTVKTILDMHTRNNL